MHAYEYGRLTRIVREGDWDALAQFAAQRSRERFAAALSMLSRIRARRAYLALDPVVADECFAYLDIEHQASLFEVFEVERARRLLASLRPDDRTRLLESLDPEATRRMILLLGPSHRSEAKQLLSYPDESVGRLMSTAFVSIHEHWSVERSLEHIRMVSHPTSRLEAIYVVDEDGSLVDELALSSFVTAEPDTEVASLIDRTFVALDVRDDREEAVRVMKRTNAFVLPVVDDGHLLGVVTADDVFDVAEAEATEDIHKSGSVTPLDSGYRHASAALLYRSRIGWLIALVFVSLVSSGVIARFESLLAERIALVFFIPLLMATGGNTGAQSATLLVRAIATDDVKLFEWWRVFGKEVLVGILLGATLALAAYVLGVFRSDATVGLIVGLTMISIVLMTNLLGAILPFVLSRLRIDPAIASAPLITSLSDALGLVIYFSFAMWLLL